MRVDSSYLMLARPRGSRDARRPDRQRQDGRLPAGPNEHYREIIGVGVLIAALIVVFWSGSLVVLALGALLAALLIFAGLLFIVWRRSR